MSINALYFSTLNANSGTNSEADMVYQGYLSFQESWKWKRSLLSPTEWFQKILIFDARVFSPQIPNILISV